MNMDSQFDDEGLYDTPDVEKEYYYDFDFKCKGFTKLMKLVLLTKKHPELVDQIAQYLIVCPEEVNKQNEYGYTALMLASRHSNRYSTEETVKVLLDQENINVNMQNKYGNTALIYVVLCNIQSNSTETAKMLIEAKADIKIKNNIGNTALKLAKFYVRKEVVKMLEEEMEQKVSKSKENENLKAENVSLKSEIESQKAEIERLRALITNAAAQI